MGAGEVRQSYDVVVAGGSIAGLLCAREVAARGHTVLVAEKSHEVGTPEHCGGLVSASALRELGISPGPGEATAPVDVAAVSHGPSGRSFEVPARRQGILVADRRRLDMQAAVQAADNGAQIAAGAELRRRGGEGAGGVQEVQVAGRRVECRAVVDATGVQSMVARHGGGGVVPCAQYVVHAGWIREGVVEVIVDAERYPGFFAWVIPMSDGIGKVGAAGSGINPGAAVGALAAERGSHSIMRRIFAPVWVGGPAASFVDGSGGERSVRAGDSAGQSKPTTAGGIFSCGMGGIMAGRALASHLESGADPDLRAYEGEWRGRFGAEFARQRSVRSALSSLDNGGIERLFKAVSPEVIAEISRGGDFDFHVLSVARMLGIRNLLGLAGAAAGARIAGGIRRARGGR